MITSVDVYKYLENHQKTSVVVISCKKYTLFIFNSQVGGHVDRMKVTFCKDF